MKGMGTRGEERGRGSHGHLETGVLAVFGTLRLVPRFEIKQGENSACNDRESHSGRLFSS